jgi:hypothetical protein
LTAREQKVLQSWLAHHPEYRIATDEDCDCADDIKQLKAGWGGTWKPVLDYHPYTVTGDFNGDGAEDFAVVLIDRSKQENNFALVVFNGPFKSGTASPAFMKSGLDLKHQGWLTARLDQNRTGYWWVGLKAIREYCSSRTVAATGWLTEGAREGNRYVLERDA